MFRALNFTPSQVVLTKVPQHFGRECLFSLLPKEGNPQKSQVGANHVLEMQVNAIEFDFLRSGF